jgi:catechol 2,3-dioxygenase-like lactoylglutathione lyase family enzyme
MALELYMVGLVAQDMDQSLEFYRRLGLAIPDDSAGQPHVEVKMSGGLTFFLNAPRRLMHLDAPRVILEFYLKERPAVDAKYAEMIGYGYTSAHAPFVTSFGMYFAMVDDPDGNTILLSAD